METESNGSLYRDTAGKRPIYQGPQRMWMNEVQIAGVVVDQPKVFYPRGTPGRLGDARLRFRLFTYGPGEDGQCYVTCWVGGHKANLAAECVNREDQLIILGSLQTFFYDKDVPKRRSPGYTFVHVRQFFQIPWREDSYFRHGTVPVETERYHELLHLADEKRRPFEPNGGDELDELLRDVGVTLTAQEVAEAKAAAVRARQRYACVLPPDKLQWKHGEVRDRVQDHPGAAGGPPAPPEAQGAVGAEGDAGGSLP